MLNQSKDFFAPAPAGEKSPLEGVAAKLAGAGLHAAKVSFLIYSGYHGISATLSYAGSSELARLAQIVGIVTLEITLLSLYVSWHTQRITGAAQSVAAGITYAVGFTLACLGIIADSQLHAGMALSGWLAGYLRWGLPLAPAAMALGALFTHELNPTQLRSRQEAAAQLAFEQDKFNAYMAQQRAQMDIHKGITNMQLNAQLSAANQIATWYGSEEAQQAITAHALGNAPALLAAIGIDVKSQAGPPAPIAKDTPDPTHPLLTKVVIKPEANGHPKL